MATNEGIDSPATGLSSSTPDFRTIYDAWVGEVSRWVHALGGPEADCDDIVQDVFVVVSRRVSAFRGDNLAGWLYRITRRQVRDFRRRSWFKYIFSKLSGTKLEQLPALMPDPSASLEQDDLRRLLYRLLDNMNDDRRFALVLFEIEGMSGQEIARIQNVPLATVWSRLHQARKDLVALAAKVREGQQEESGR